MHKMFLLLCQGSPQLTEDRHREQDDIYAGQGTCAFLPCRQSELIPQHPGHYGAHMRGRRHRDAWTAKWAAFSLVAWRFLSPQTRFGQWPHQRARSRAIMFQIANSYCSLLYLTCAIAILSGELELPGFSLAVVSSPLQVKDDESQKHAPLGLIAMDPSLGPLLLRPAGLSALPSRGRNQVSARPHGESELSQHSRGLGDPQDGRRDLQEKLSGPALLDFASTPLCCSFELLNKSSTSACARHPQNQLPLLPSHLF